MRITTKNGWRGEVVGATVTQVDMEEGESLVVEPGTGQRAIVLLVSTETEPRRRAR